MSDIILEVKDLNVEFDTYGGIVKAVRGVDFSVKKGKTLAIVGESGCGKSVTVQSIMGLIPMPPGRVTKGSAKLKGKEILGLSTKELNEIRGKEVGMIFQDAMSSLNPTMKIGDQIAETLKVHRGMSHGEAIKKAIELLAKTRIPEPERRANQYPFEFSGGMLQRSMISVALACSPTLLIADEPTTALDVTIQMQILELIKDLQKTEQMSLIIITHDLGVVAQVADEVAVMYAGKIAETGPVDNIFYEASHPYTEGLRMAMPQNDEHVHKRLRPIEGSPPDLFSPPKGCGYFARCPYAMKICEKNDPLKFLVKPNHYSFCWLSHEQAPKVKREIFVPRSQ
ncbi:MAG: peptide ABC transporter ATP-binding protein [Proteobacteria bacterium SG_bin7]|nr:MAG: peptide ABC transporter ATP-binding protein [Proteobacteria bacterium SG_bin7]